MAVAALVACPLSLGLILAPALPHRGACHGARRRARCCAASTETAAAEQRAYRVAVPAANSEPLAARTKKQVEVKPKGIQVVTIVARPSTSGTT